MFKRLLSVLIVLGLAWALTYPANSLALEIDPNCGDGQLCYVKDAFYLSDKLKGINTSVDDPAWFGLIVEFTYSIETRGSINTNLEDFTKKVHQTLNDSMGWIQLGVKFTAVESGGDFSVVLAEAFSVPSFSLGCSSEYSCRVGRYAIINQDRWNGATDPWNNAGGSLRDYRHMVVNHEVGHWLGHSHATCGGAGQLAFVMQQQSINLDGCTFNPWPLDSEMWTSRL